MYNIDENLDTPGFTSDTEMVSRISFSMQIRMKNEPDHINQMQLLLLNVGRLERNIFT
jgi:hypothetical protein